MRNQIEYNLIKSGGGTRPVEAQQPEFIQGAKSFGFAER